MTATDSFPFHHTFMYYLLWRSVEITDVDDWVQLWHEGGAPADVSLHTFLGMTWVEYSEWVKDPRAIIAIAAGKFVEQMIEEYDKDKPQQQILPL